MYERVVQPWEWYLHRMLHKDKGRASAAPLLQAAEVAPRSTPAKDDDRGGRGGGGGGG